MDGWYYMKEGDGTLKAKTKVAHPKHTRGQWTFLDNIPAAKKNIEAGEKERAEKILAERAAKEQAKQDIKAQAALQKEQQ